MNPDTLSSVVTVGVFGVIGWLLARRLSRPLGRVMLVVLPACLLGAAIAGRFVGPQTRLVSFGEFAVRLNWSLVGICLGGCNGLLLRNRELRQLESARPS
jgi:hypothetical protein